VRDSERYPWVFRLSNPKLYIDNPVVIDLELRSRLEEFNGRDAGKSWAWYVQGTGQITSHDFQLLTAAVAAGPKAKG
jgi:hypothetical protein